MVFAVSWKASAAKLPCVGLWLNASKSESMLKRDDFYPHYIYAITNRVCFGILRNHTRGYRFRRGSVSCSHPWMITSNINEDKSFADDLNLERGIVSSRVALLLRSAEIKPIVLWFVLIFKNFFFFSSLLEDFRRVVKNGWYIISIVFLTLNYFEFFGIIILFP